MAPPPMAQNSPAYLAAVGAGAPSRQNPGGTQLYRDAYSQSFQKDQTGPMSWLSQGFLQDPSKGMTQIGPGTYAGKGSTTAAFTAGPQVPSIAQQLATLASSGGGAATGSNLSAYGGSGEYPTTPTPSPLSYLGLPDYQNLGSNFTGGNNYSNPFAGLFGNNTQTNFLSTWT